MAIFLLYSLFAIRYPLFAPLQHPKNRGGHWQTCRLIPGPFPALSRLHGPPVTSTKDGRLAQVVEQLTLNQRVVGSSPTSPTILRSAHHLIPFAGRLVQSRRQVMTAVTSNRKSRHMAHKVIISCAVTGSIHTPTMSEHLPQTPEQIATSAIGAAEAGAAILHLHARDPATGKPTSDAAVYMQFLPRIKQATNAVINITTGGSMLMSVDQRLEGPQLAAPEMCSLNMGSMNFGLFPLLQKYKEWKHSWEPEMLAATEDAIFKNTFKDIARILQVMGEKHGTRFEHECYDVGHLYNLAHFVDKGALKPPFFVQMIFGILGGIGADMRNLMFMKETADKLFGKDYRWSVLGAGKNQMPFCTQAAMMGGNVRVGLEDSLYIGRGKLATSNAEQVRKIRTIIEELGLEIATPDEARTMLALKGGDKVGF